MPNPRWVMRKKSVLALACASGMLAGCGLIAGVDFDGAQQALAEGGAPLDARADVVLADPSEPGSDAAAPVDAGDADGSFDAADANPCDLDHDGYERMDGSCGGTDCDDNDDRAHPGAGYVSAPAVAPLFGDWNCDGMVEKRYRTNATCDAPMDVTCGLRDGFTGDPPCGTTGPLINCAMIGATCGILSTPTKTQTCR